MSIQIYNLYDKIDPECLNLVKAFNKLPGIRTLECCCGHGKSNYRIFFKQHAKDSTRGLAFLGRIMSRRYNNFAHNGWSITLYDVGDTYGCGVFVLEGPIGEEAYKQADDMAGKIEKALQENIWPLSIIERENNN